MRRALPDEAPDNYGPHADLLAALAHPLRLRILARLAAGPCCVSELIEEAQTLQPRVSRHLAVLRDAGIVECEVDGRRRCYHLRQPELVRSLFALLDRTDLPDPGGA